MKDFLGRDLYVGATIVYPAMWGQSIRMQFARIVALKENGNVNIRSINGNWHPDPTKWVLSKIVTISRTENIVLVNPTEIPADAMNLLNQVPAV